MADLSTLARPYANAAFDYANEQGVVDDWAHFLVVANALVVDPAFKTLLDNPAITAKQRAQTLIDLYDSQITAADDNTIKQMVRYYNDIADEGALDYVPVSEALSNFVQQLAQNKRLNLLPQIYTHYQQLKAQSRTQVVAYVTTAYPLTDDQRQNIKTRLSASLNADVVIKEAVDKDLLAGANIKIGDKVVEDSMRSKLRQLKTQLIAR